MKKRIAPRLADGTIRDSNTHCLPPGVKKGLKAIARRERESVSWVLEKIIIEYFNLDEPEYIHKGKKNASNTNRGSTSTKGRL